MGVEIVYPKGWEEAHARGDAGIGERAFALQQQSARDAWARRSIKAVQMPRDNYQSERRIHSIPFADRLAWELAHPGEGLYKEGIIENPNYCATPAKRAKRKSAPKPVAGSQVAESAYHDARIAELQAEIVRLRSMLAEPKTESDARRAVAALQLPDNLHVIPWTREDGKEYLTLERVSRRGAKRFAIPVEYVKAVGNALLSA